MFRDSGIFKLLGSLLQRQFYLNRFMQRPYRGSPATLCLAAVTPWNHGERTHRLLTLLSLWSRYRGHNAANLRQRPPYPHPPHTLSNCISRHFCLLKQLLSRSRKLKFSPFTSWKHIWVGSCLQGTLPKVPMKRKRPLLKDLLNFLIFSLSTCLSYNVKLHPILFLFQILYLHISLPYLLLFIVNLHKRNQ